MLLDRLNTYDLDTLELVKQPTREMISALVNSVRNIRAERDEIELELDSLKETLECMGDKIDL